MALRCAGRSAPTHIGNVNPIRYRGYYYDTETGLYYLQARYYDPETGRFLSQDHISYLDPEHLTGLNLFAYCNNNPVMYADPSGHFVITIGAILSAIGIGAAIGAGIGFGAAYISDVIENAKIDGFQWSDLNTFSSNWKHYIEATLGGAIAGAGIGLCSVLGAGIGVAMSAGSTLTITASAGVTTGLTLNAGAALAIGASGAFITGGLGYWARVGISDQESFQWSDLFIEAGANTISGLLTFTSAMVGGILGVKVPGAKFSFKNFALYHLGATYFGVYPIKGILSYIKQKLKESY